MTQKGAFVVSQVSAHQFRVTGRRASAGQVSAMVCCQHFLRLPEVTISRRLLRIAKEQNKSLETRSDKVTAVASLVALVAPTWHALLWTAWWCVT